MIWSRCASVTAPPAHDGVSLPLLHRKIETSTLSYQKSFIVDTCARTSSAAPNRPSETATVMITAMVIVRLRRRPVPTSLATNGRPHRAYP